MEAARNADLVTEAHLAHLATQECELVVGEVAALTIDAEGRCTGGTAFAWNVAGLPVGHRYATVTATATGLEFGIVNV